ncbi:hypothetical protein [Rhizobium paknamense]|uniref:Uncharacterized protein n=1 Tax=Rhizobium paknamense TaxID=1206817 RepID=A0ABU0ID33_9HYPH|nr:hypothetical protein [Rhizobium paknamense]MDQ0455528.1 hypothetical protein [Rhizobium paknamense]
MTDANVSEKQPNPSASRSGEQTVRLGAAHGDGQLIGSFFSRPKIGRSSQDEIIVEPEFPADQASEAYYPPATWLDAMQPYHYEGAIPDRNSTFDADDNGLYRMHLAEVA